MSEPTPPTSSELLALHAEAYQAMLTDITGLLEQARRAAARTVNTIMTHTYWQIGQMIVEFEQGGQDRAAYGQEVLKRLSADLSRQFGRGFSERNLQYMRLFYVTWPKSQTPSAKSSDEAEQFPLPWSHYVCLLAVEGDEARRFYETQARANEWSVRNLRRQIDTRVYERTLLSRNKAAMLEAGKQQRPEDTPTPEEEIKDPFILEFLDLKDEYSESELEAALIHKLEAFLLELGGDFAFVSRQRRMRVGNSWYRVDLVFFHRGLRCLVLIDLKLEAFTPADVGQMHLYVNYARENWMRPGENPPVGLILCATKDEAVARYALEGLPNKVMAAEYQMALPDEETLLAELDRTRKQLEDRRAYEP